MDIPREAHEWIDQAHGTFRRELGARHPHARNARIRLDLGFEGDDAGEDEDEEVNEHAEEFDIEAQMRVDDADDGESEEEDEEEDMEPTIVGRATRSSEGCERREPNRRVRGGIARRVPSNVAREIHQSLARRRLVRAHPSRISFPVGFRAGISVHASSTAMAWACALAPRDAHLSLEIARRERVLASPAT